MKTILKEILLFISYYVEFKNQMVVDWKLLTQLVDVSITKYLCWNLLKFFSKSVHFNSDIFVEAIWLQIVCTLSYNAPIFSQNKTFLNPLESSFNSIEL